MKVIKNDIVNESLKNNFLNTALISEEIWKELVRGLWDQVEHGLFLKHSTWKCNHKHWENWIGNVI